MDQTIFAETWHGKRVRCKGECFSLFKGAEGVVTMALYRGWDDNTTIFAVDFDKEDATPLWVSFHIEDKNLYICMDDFEVIK